MKIQIEGRVLEYIRNLPEKDQRVIGENIERLTQHPHVSGNIKRLHTRKPRWRMHISSKYTLFYYVDSDTIWVDKIMTIEQAHKKYGNL